MGHIEIPTLMFATLGIAVVIGFIVLVRFRSQPGNNHPMSDQRERNMGEIERGDPPADH